MATTEQAVILTPEQVENWRKILIGMIGPYAFLMTAEQIQKTRDRMQERVNGLTGSLR